MVLFANTEVVATVFLGIIAAVVLAGVPWAFFMERRMSRIETKIDGMIIPPPWFEEKVNSHGDRLKAHSDKLDHHSRALDECKHQIERALKRRDELP